MQAGDLIPICSSFANVPRLANVMDPTEHDDGQPIRVMTGREWAFFSEQSRQDFLTGSYTLTGDSDRMGYRLTGEALTLETPCELLSESVAFGTVQVPPSGQPLILMADRQTTGGYPRIAQVASVDLPRLAQMLPGDTLQFSLIDLHDAQRLFIDRARSIKAMEAFNA